MKSSSLLILGIWLCVLGLESWAASNAIHASQCLRLRMPIPTFTFVLPIVLFGTMALIARRSPFYSPFFARIVDAKYGPSALESFLVHLKPLLLFGLTALLGGIVQIWLCREVAGSYSHGLGSLSVSAGAAFIFAHAILRYRGAKGV